YFLINNKIFFKRKKYNLCIFSKKTKKKKNKDGVGCFGKKGPREYLSKSRRLLPTRRAGGTVNVCL
ncbi:hypothetical protein J9A39_17570, partial [Klebsiella pneumoniae]